MLRKIMGIGGLVLVGLLLVGAVTAWAFPQDTEAANGSGWGSGQGPGSRSGAGWSNGGIGGYGGDLSESEVEALNLALDDEYKAWSIYDQVIADFGAVWPFSYIQKAEENHIAALVGLFDHYGLDVPENSWLGNVPTFDTVAEACTAGVEAEIDNAALYDQLFSMVDNPDILQVFTNLQWASETKHLPAFEGCAE